MTFHVLSQPSSENISFEKAGGNQFKAFKSNRLLNQTVELYNLFKRSNIATTRCKIILVQVPMDHYRYSRITKTDGYNEKK